MKKEHREKINEAIIFCEKKFEAFHKALAAFYGKTEAHQYRDFLLQNTVIAGGVFRSMFTGTPVNDVDVFFKSQDAAIEFKHIFSKAKDQKMFFNPKQITDNQTYNWSEGPKNTKLSFITKYAQDPHRLMDTFDFSFNQHWLNLQSYEMSFDRDTFDKKGAYLNIERKDKADKIQMYMRALKFTQQGFKIDPISLMSLGAELSGQTFREVEAQTLRSRSGSAILEAVHITGDRITDRAYFGEETQQRMQGFETTGNLIYQNIDQINPTNERFWNQVPGNLGAGLGQEQALNAIQHPNIRAAEELNTFVQTRLGNHAAITPLGHNAIWNNATQAWIPAPARRPAIDPLTEAPLTEATLTRGLEAIREILTEEEEDVDF